MRGKVALVLVTMSLIFAVSASVWAGSFGNSAPNSWGTASAPQAASQAPQSASGPKVVPYNATFNLTPTSDVVGSTCPDGYAHQCASGSCECVEFTGTGHGTTFGTSTNLAFELTLDRGNAPTSDPNGTCFPAFGEIFLVGSKENEAIDVVGAACINFKPPSSFSGGFEFAGSSNPIFDAEGQTATGKFTGTTTFVLKLSGKACNGTSACP
jgi:hypothetical protein